LYQRERIQILFPLKSNFVLGSWKSTGRPGVSGYLFLPEPSVTASYGLQFQRRGSSTATTQNRQAQVKAKHDVSCGVVFELLKGYHV